MNQSFYEKMFKIYLICDNEETSSKSSILKLKYFWTIDVVLNEILTWEVIVNSIAGMICKNLFASKKFFLNIIFADFLALLLCFGIANAAEFNICHDKPDGVFIRDFSSCNNYISCYNRLPLYGRCPDGFAFNSLNSMCDYPENVDCGSICPRNGTATFKFERSCTKYIRCIGGYSSFVECPEGLYYDDHHGNCNLPDEVDCEQFICSASGAYLVPSHEDCAS